MCRLPGELVPWTVLRFPTEVGEGVVVDAKPTLHELRVGVPHEHRLVLEGPLKRLGEQATLRCRRCGVVVLAKVPDEPHLHRKDAWVVVPGHPEFCH